MARDCRKKTETKQVDGLARGRIEIGRRIVTTMLSNCSEMLFLGTYRKTWCSMVSEQTCTIDHKNGPKLVTNAWIAWYLIFIIYVNTNSNVMWVILQNNAGWDCFKTPILQEILRNQNPLLEEHYAFLEVIHLFQQVGCKKQTSVSHGSTESEIISVDAGLRLDGIPALDLWDLIVLVLGNTNSEPW